MKVSDDYVKMEQHQCPVCGVLHTHNTGILLHKRLKAIKEEHTVTGFGMCEEHDKLREDDFVACVELSGEPPVGETMTVAKSFPLRTGNVAHVRRPVLEGIIENPCPTDMIFVDMGFITKLQELTADAV